MDILRRLWKFISERLRIIWALVAVSILALLINLALSEAQNAFGIVGIQESNWR
jgi:hypothetical protein